MEKLHVTKVERVWMQRKGRCSRGTLHLSRHHLIFRFDEDQPLLGSGKEIESPGSVGLGLGSERELWIPFSLLILVVRLPAVVPPHLARRSAHARIYPLLVRLRNFESLALGFGPECVTATGSAEVRSTEVWESVKDNVVVSSPTELFAFSYSPDPPLPLRPRGWQVYNFERELQRQGVGTRTKGWRVTGLNADFSFCPTYPSQLCIPERITDATLRYAAKYRSKARIPALTYLHWANLGTITRSSQPMVGINNRSLQDEKLIEAIFTSHLYADPSSAAARAADAAARQAEYAAANGHAGAASVAMVYGATATNLIIDARPTTNAMANRAKGAGTENMDHYKGCKKAFLGVDNIHVMRDSLNRITDALREAEAPITFSRGVDHLGEGTVGDSAVDLSSLRRSGWLKHISALLEGTLLIVRNIHVNSSHVLIHCSDGWDRTSQLAALAQLCLDPYFRTLEGFAVLVEKDFCSFGHRFWDRCGHAGSEKYFTTARGYGEESDEFDAQRNGGDRSGNRVEVRSGFEAHSQAAANAFWGFTRQLAHNLQSSASGAGSHAGNGGHGGAHLKEISPVFHQFLDCVWQVMRQFPERFEFGAEWLLELHTQLYECRFGTFVANSQRERRTGTSDASGLASAARVEEKTISVWDWLLDDTRRSRFVNGRYDRSLDDPKRENADMGVLFPDARRVRYFGRLFGRSEEEMNAGVVAEEEERRKIQEAAARARSAAAAQAAARAAAETAARSEIGEPKVGPIVGSASEDPILSARAAQDAAQPGAQDRMPHGQGSSSNGSTTPRDGVVDLATRSDRQPLAYKPRVPRANLNARLQAAAAEASSRSSGHAGLTASGRGGYEAPSLSNGAYQAEDGSLGPARVATSPLPTASQRARGDAIESAASTSGDGSDDRREGDGDAVSRDASRLRTEGTPAAASLAPVSQDVVDPSSDAAARMRGLLLSGWGRLQAAYQDATTAASVSTPASPPGPMAGADSGIPSTIEPLPPLPPPSVRVGELSSNPWATNGTGDAATAGHADSATVSEQTAVESEVTMPLELPTSLEYPPARTKQSQKSASPHGRSAPGDSNADGQAAQGSDPLGAAPW